MQRGWGCLWTCEGEEMSQLRNNIESWGILRILQCGSVGVKKGVLERSQNKGWSEQEADFLILKHKEVSVSEKMQEETWKRTKGEEGKIKPSGTEGIAGDWERV